MNTPTIQWYENRWTYDDMEHPDFDGGELYDEGVDEITPDVFDVEDCYVEGHYNPSVMLAIDIIKNQHYTTEFSASRFYLGGWYMDEAHLVDHYKGVWSTKTLHLKGFAPHEEAIIYEAVTGRKVL